MNKPSVLSRVDRAAELHVEVLEKILAKSLRAACTDERLLSDANRLKKLERAKICCMQAEAQKLFKLPRQKPSLVLRPKVHPRVEQVKAMSMPPMGKNDSATCWSPQSSKPPGRTFNVTQSTQKSFKNSSLSPKNANIESSTPVRPKKHRELYL